MSEKKVGKRLLTWVLVLVMTLSLLPLNVLAANPAVMRVVRPDTDKYITYKFYNGEAKVDEQIIKTGNTLLEPEIETQKGKRLKGWYTAQENGDLFTGFGNYTSEITESTTINLYARFEDVYYVYFTDTTGRIVATKEGKSGDGISVNDVKFPVGNDESITGWYLEDDTNKTPVPSVTLSNTNVTLCAIVENGYWITFESDSGSYVAPQFVRSGEPCTAPSDPTKPGYDFAGWYKDGTKFTFDSSLTENLTLTAHWTEKKDVQYTVIHWLENADNDEYSIKKSESKIGTAGNPTAATAKSYDGFTAQAITQKVIAGDGSTIVNVYYKRNVYTVKFYSYSSWVSRSEEYTNLRITAKYGANISDKWPTYDGSRTWSTNDSKNEGPYQVNLQTMPLGGANFYGPKTGRGSETAYYYVESLTGGKYELHHSDTTPGTGYSVTDEDRYPITGFTFKTYTAEQGGDWFNGYYEKYDGARFYYTRNSYNIVFINGGAEDKTLSKKYQQDISDANYTPTAPAGKVGYEFAGWYDNELCEGTAYGFTGKTMPAQNITVYAKWKAPTFTVTVYDVDKETKLKTFENVPLRGTISKDVMPTGDVTLVNGDTFLGWTYEDGTPFNFNTAITKNIDLYARVGNKIGYSVTYVVDSSITNPQTKDTQKYAKNSNATVLNNLDSLPANKVFLGWTTKENGTTVEYYPNSSIEITGNVTLYAVYGDKAKTVTVTYHSNFGSTDSTYTTKAMPNNGKFSVADYSALDLPENNGYKFIGWSTTSGEKAVEFKKGDDARADTNGSNDLYAQWEKTTIDDEVIVTITGNSDTKVYNGSEQSVTGYEVKSISNPLYNESSIKFTGTATATGTNAGTYQMGLKAEQFENKNSQFTNVKFEVTDGWLKIEPRNVILTSASDEKVYDGTPLTKSDVTVGGNGFVEGEVSNITATGSVTNVSEGEVANTIVYTTGAKFNANNYNIQKTEGKLKITPITNEVTVTITGNHDTKVYNASEQSVSGYTTDVNGKTISVALKEGSKAEAKGINVGKYDMHLTAADFTVSSTNYSNINVVVNDGYLEITPVTDEVTVTITGNTKTVMYNGSEQSVSGYTTDVDGKTISVALKDGSKAEAKGINVGKYDMHLTAADFTVSSTNYSNIKVVVNDGYLEITPITETATVTITGNHNSVKYNGREQSVTGFTYTAPEGVTVALRDSFKAEAKGTNVGTYKMDLTSEYFTVTSNIYKEFKIVVNDGYLEITRSGGHHPRPKPTVEIEDDDALGLNTTDHFAYIVGYGNGEVRPQNNITRAEVATIFFRLLTDDVRDENLTKANRYSDVAATSWYNTAVSTLSSMGIITGYPDGTFRPNAAITRAEFAAIAARFDHDGDKTAAKFSDIASHWAKDEISIAYNNGWITGYPDGTFGPQRDITRAETMTLVNRVLNRQPETEDDLLPNMTVWTDNANPKAWYYLAVQEATNSHYYEFKKNSQYEKWTELRETRDWTQLEK